MTSRMSAALVVLVAAVSGAGCSSRSAPVTASTTTVATSLASPIPIDQEVAAGPGTALGNGFEVASGSVLVAPPIPAAAGTESFGWNANLVVPGDPRPVMTAYRAQARRAGFDTVTSTGPLEPGATRAPVCDQAFGGSYRCELHGYDHHDKSRRFYAVFARGPARKQAPPFSYLDIAYVPGSESALPLVDQGSGPVGSEPSGAEPPAIQRDWPHLAGPGERFGDGYVVYPPPNSGGAVVSVSGFKVESGSKMATPETPIDSCSLGTYRAVLTVTGNPRTVYRGYVDQAIKITGDEPPLRRRGRTPAGVVTDTIVARTGDDSYGLVLYEPKRGRPIIVISSCLD